jgi:hypothetical protein
MAYFYFVRHRAIPTLGNTSSPLRQWGTRKMKKPCQTTPHFPYFHEHTITRRRSREISFWHQIANGPLKERAMALHIRWQLSFIFRPVDQPENSYAVLPSASCLNFEPLFPHVHCLTTPWFSLAASLLICPYWKIFQILPYQCIRALFRNLNSDLQISWMWTYRTIGSDLFIINWSERSM